MQVDQSKHPALEPVGKVAYEAYMSSRGAVPEWERLSKSQMLAWNAAACAAICSIRTGKAVFTVGVDVQAGRIECDVDLLMLSEGDPAKLAQQRRLTYRK